MKSDERLSRAFAYYPRLKRVQEFVDEHLAEPISLKDAARVASLDAKYFSKFFKAKTGVTFFRWLHDRRVTRAIKLLKNEEIPVSAVAREVGFSSERTFLRAFREKTGTTPSNYRKALEARLILQVRFD